MKEKTAVLLITSILIIIGLIIGAIYSVFIISLINKPLSDKYYDFNFNRADLSINGSDIKETLYFHTDKSYHTLFRTFDSNIASTDSFVSNSVSILNVQCKSGTAYYKINDFCYYSPDFTIQQTCKPNTENNEYGCTFGDFYGFNSDEDYQIYSKYRLNPENLFKINNVYYIKFIAYGRNKHTAVTTGENLFITGEVVTYSHYKPGEYVIIYIPYKGDYSKYNIIEKENFEYDITTKQPINKYLIIFIFILLTLIHTIPGILFYTFWYYFGKELIEPEVPSQRSDYPEGYKPWQVASFFNPPFATIDNNFFSSIILDFYRRKIIDIKIKKRFFKDDMLIKINNTKFNLDNIEKEFLEILSYLNDSCENKYKEDGFFNINKASKGFTTQIKLRTKYQNLQKLVKTESKIYIEKKGLIILTSILVVLCFASFAIFLYGIFIISIITLIIILISSFISPLLLKYKGEFYNDYKEWQAFKKWLSYSSSMKSISHKGVVMWDEILVYATALGVSKRVLNELKDEGLINERQYKTYIGIHTAAISFAGSPSSGGHGGGFGGAGGGGVGGGGGGGR